MLRIRLCFAVHVRGCSSSSWHLHHLCMQLLGEMHAVVALAVPVERHWLCLARLQQLCTSVYLIKRWACWCVECHREPQPRPGTTAVTYQPQDTDSDDEAWLRTDIPDPRQKHSNKRTPAVLLTGPAYPLDTHTQPPHKRPCTSQHICATPEPQPNTVPHGHTTDPSNDAEANGGSSLRRVS